MTDIVASITSAMLLAARIQTMSAPITDTEFQNALAELRATLAETKTQAADLMAENTDLKQQIRELKAEGERCPRCGKPTWRLQEIRPDPAFHVLGVSSGAYKCLECGLTRTKPLD